MPPRRIVACGGISCVLVQGQGHRRRAHGGPAALALIGAAIAISGGDAPARVAPLRLGRLVLLALVLAVMRASRFVLDASVTVGAVVALALAAALAGDELLSSLLVGPLIVGVAVSKADWTGIALERDLGVAVRRVGLPVCLGPAALHTDLHELGSGLLAPVLGLLSAVIALRVGGADDGIRPRRRTRDRRPHANTPAS